MQEVLVNGSGGLSLSRKSVVRLKTDHPDMTIDVYHGRKIQQQQLSFAKIASYGSVANSAKCVQIAADPEYVSQQC